MQADAKIRSLREQIDAIWSDPTAPIPAIELSQAQAWGLLIDNGRCTAAEVGLSDGDFELVIDSHVTDGWPITRDRDNDGHCVATMHDTLVVSGLRRVRKLQRDPAWNAKVARYAAAQIEQHGSIQFGFGMPRIEE